MNERPTGPRSSKSIHGFPSSKKSIPAATVQKKPRGLTYRQQRQLLGVILVAVAILIFGLVWVIRSTTLPELVPLLNLPTLSPAPPRVAALIPSPTPTVIAPQPTAPNQVRSVAPTPIPDGEGRLSTIPPAPTTTAGPSTVYFPYLNFVVWPTPTSVPQAFVIAPPLRSWPESLPGLTASKLGLHVISNNDPDILEFVRRAHPRVLVAVDELGWLAEAKAASSATMTVARFTGEPSASWPETLDPETAAKTYINQWLENYRLNPSVDYWAGWNDFRAETETRWQWYAEFEAARVCQMQALGLRAAVGGFSTEILTENVMAWFMPALAAADKCDGLLTLQAYNAPTLACGLSAASAASPTLGYRLWYEKYLRPAGLDRVPLVISELAIRGPSTHCGDPGNLTPGWKSYTGWWVTQGLGADGLQTYLNMLTWYDSEIRGDAYVVGAAIFTAGASGVNLSWQAFDVHDLINPLTHYAVNQLPPAAPATGYP